MICVLLVKLFVLECHNNAKSKAVLKVYLPENLEIFNTGKNSQF